MLGNDFESTIASAYLVEAHVCAQSFLDNVGPLARQFGALDALKNRSQRLEQLIVCAMACYGMRALDRQDRSMRSRLQVEVMDRIASSDSLRPEVKDTIRTFAALSMSAEEDTKVAEQLLSSVFFHWNALSGAWVRFGQDRHLVQLLVFYFSDAIMMWRRVTETYADSGKLGALSAALSTSNSQPNEHIGQGVPWWIWLLGGILLSKLLN